MTRAAAKSGPRRRRSAATPIHRATRRQGATYTSAERVGSRMTERAPPVAKIEYIEVDGVTLRVAIRAGRGTPLLLFNGIGANLELVLPFIAALRGREAVVFDMPGVGRSPMWLIPRRFSGIASLTDHLLDRLG